MRYFKLNDQIFAYDNDQEHLIEGDMVEIKGKALDKILNPLPTAVELRPLTNRQFKLALLDSDLIDDVESAIGNIEDPTLKRRIQIEYEYATTFNRDSDSIAVMIALLKLPTENVDEVWIHALTL